MLIDLCMDALLDTIKLVPFFIHNLPGYGIFGT